MGLLGSIFGGGGTDVEQTTDVDIVNENLFAPVVDITLNGLDTLGSALRDGFNAITGQGQNQTQSLNQGAFNIATSIDGAGVNISNGIVGASENIEDGVTKAGVNVAAAVVISATVMVLGGALRRGK